jgi:ribose 5-phosphate isomerase B
MKVAIGADAYGYPLKLVALQWLKANGHKVNDVGIHGMEADEKILDYADAVAKAVAKGKAERGILLCKSGGAMCIRANRWPGVRAVVDNGGPGLKHDREACDVNILCFAAQYESAHLLEHRLKVFFDTAFEPLSRRVKRLKRLDAPVA